MKKKTLVAPSVEEKIKSWLKNPYDEETREEIKRLMKKAPKELEESFSHEIAFGTAGLREKMGPGPGRMNKYTIRTVTQGLANYILTFKESEWKGGVVICHEARLHSREFAEETAKVLAGNKIPVHLTSGLRPTPFASFAIRNLHAIAGINITASHNPKEYNGYKVYWADGGQIVSPHDAKIIEEIKKITSQDQVKLSTLSDPLIKIISPETEKAYLQAILNLALLLPLSQKRGKSLKIIYSPLNGAGITMIPEALKGRGFTDTLLVEEQRMPDGNFPTTPYPNPEKPEALALGLRDLKKKKGDILLVSDPDSDRLSCSILHEGKPYTFTGNELGALLLHFLITQKHPKGKWATVTTIVSTPLIKLLTEKAGGTCFEVLTGFKYIGEKIHLWEQSKAGYSFFFGMEESLGYLYGTHARDKDATIAACLAAEMALFYKENNQNLLEALHELYRQYGIHRESQASIEFPEGSVKMEKLLSKLRTSPPARLANVTIVQIEDYQTGKGRSLLTKKEWKLTLPKSNVLVYTLEDGSRFIIRPSGTEPKLKIYGQVSGTKFQNVEEGIAALDRKVAEMLHQITKAHFPTT